MHRKHTYFREGKRVRSKKIYAFVGIAIAILAIAAGAYVLLLTRSPDLPISSSIDLNTADDAQDTRNRIQIEKINLEVPYYDDNTPATLERGAWWRFPDRGNPEKGGNFILSAHRFYLGTTPQGTRARSPFYKLNELAAGDKIRVFYEGKWYDYEVTRNYSVSPSAIEIEEPSAEAKMTLYTCSLKGSADGRVVIDAKPLFETASQRHPENGSPLL